MKIKKRLSFLKLMFREMTFLFSYFRFKKLKSKTPIYLELGSGAKKGKNGWITIDVNGADISWDLRKGIPLPDGSVEKIYSSHLLEHIPFQELILFLKECHRVLKTGGEFSVCVPNFAFYINAYQGGNMFKPRESWWREGAVSTNSLMDQLNYIIYMGGEHKYMFDSENLINTLKQGGFVNSKLRPYDEKIDLKERDFESIYAVSIK